MKLDGSAQPVKLESGLAFDSYNLFASRWAGMRLVVATQPSAGSTTVDVSSFDSATGFAKIDLAAGVKAFATTETASRVAILASDGTLTTKPVVGGSSTPIDTGVSSIAMLPDGNTLVYATASGELKRAGADGTSPVILIPTGFTSVALPWIDGDPHEAEGVSPDGKKFVVVGANAVQVAQAVIWLGTGASEPLDRGETFLNFRGDIFTADSAFVLYERASTKALAALPVAGGQPIDIDPMNSVGAARALGGSRVIYATDQQLRIIDVANPTSPMVFAPKQVAEPYFYLTAARDRVVYTKSVSGGVETWVADIPK